VACNKTIRITKKQRIKLLFTKRAYFAGQPKDIQLYFLKVKEFFNSFQKKWKALF
jgi:hypothetical protein